MSFIILVIIVAIIVWIVKGKGYDAARARNSIVSWATGEEGFCHECKHCVRDAEHRYSQADWYCTIGKCNYIDENTRNNCFEKPTVTEEDLRELFSLGIWTVAGQNYIRDSILGKKMTFSEVDDFLKEVPKKFPQFIDPEYIKNRNEE